MKKLIMCKGLPASGKSTFAKEYVREHIDTRRVNKDDLRMSIDSGRWSKTNEESILKIRDYVIINTLDSGRSIIVDDTNLAPKHEVVLRNIALENKAQFEVKDFTDVPLQECIKRDDERANGVGKAVIMKMYNQYLKPTIKQSDRLVSDPDLPDCYIFDIDGTLAIMGDRSPYDWSKVMDDEWNPPVCLINKIIGDKIERSKLPHKIFIFSGRDSICREDTEAWLAFHKIAYDKLVMRKKGDMTKDSIIKQGFYEEHIKGKYNVLGIFDDRLQVCRMWHSLGLPLFRVGDPESDF